MRLQALRQAIVIALACAVSIPCGMMSMAEGPLIPANNRGVNHQRRPVAQNNQLLYEGEFYDVKILRSPYGHYIASGIRECFLRAGIAATITEAVEKDDAFKNVLYFVLHAFNYEFPVGLRYLVYQLEQKQQSAWFDEKYLKILNTSDYVFDYSIQNYQHMDTELQKKMAYLPVPLTLADGEYEEFEHDVLFYGGICPRRKRILDELQNTHGVRIKVVSDAFGKRLDELIQKTRIVLNLHYYENALLETTRINEALQWGKIVVSEEPMVEDKYSRDIYKNVVIFTKNLDEYDERHVEELARTLKFYSVPENYEKFIDERQRALFSLKEYCFGRFVRALHSLQAYSPKRFYKRLHPGTIYYFSLDESWETSRETFLKQAHLPGNLRHVASIKTSPEWIGRGMSYKLAINSAKLSELSQITMCEDNVRFPASFGRDYQIIRDYLSTLDTWHVFVGLMTNLDKRTMILDVRNYKGLEFVTIDKFTSAAFSIFNANSFEHVLSWNERHTNDDANTIDGHLQSKDLRVLTVNPAFLDNLNIENTFSGDVGEYANDYETSARLLSAKVQKFKSTQKKPSSFSSRTRLFGGERDASDHKRARRFSANYFRANEGPSQRGESVKRKEGARNFPRYK